VIKREQDAAIGAMREHHVTNDPAGRCRFTIGATACHFWQASLD